jgi:3-hydroxyacyl-CoA dehydrogenase
MAIHKIAVFGSGVMGAAIAAHCANAGAEVTLLDIVPKDATNRNQLAIDAIERMSKASPSPFAHPSFAKRITPGNIEDDIAKLGDHDWMIEAIVEKLEIKQSLYKKLYDIRKKTAVISSNTSTLPLHELTKGMPEDFRQHFMITHFFNPPRFMPLLELVPGEADPKLVEEIRSFCDIALGKGVVDCNDTPGFIANRIGCFWLVAGLVEALKLGISVEEADSVMGKPLGFPKTGMFGLYDLIGIDLMPLIAKSMLATLPQEDAFRHIYAEPELVTKMIADGYTGRKGKGGFYRMVKDDKGGKKKEVINLKTGEYAKPQKPQLASVEAAKSGLATLMTHPDIGGQYAWSVMRHTLAYAASLIPEISSSLSDVDAAMRMGYNWKYGPFELIDRLASEGKSGPAWFAEKLKAENNTVPPLLEKAGDKPFYAIENNQRTVLTPKGAHAPIPLRQDAWQLADKTRGKEPLLKNASARLWDVDDGVFCIELTSKMNSVDPDIMTLIVQSVQEVQKRGAKGLMIGGDAENFSVGANLNLLLFVSNVAAWDQIDTILKQGQDAYMALKYAPFPVVAALGGMALGGGCELVLHCDAVQAHLESYIGLVEVGVGLVPGWGGCKEMALRWLQNPPAGGPIPPLGKVFEMLATGKVSTSAYDAMDMQILRKQSPAGGDRISMNRARLLADAKSRLLELAEHYTPPVQAGLRMPGPSALEALMLGAESLHQQGKASAHDMTVARYLATVITGGDTDMTSESSEQDLLDLERKVFIPLLKTSQTLARIEYMLANGKPLRN